MSDIRSSTTTLEDVTTQAGRPLHAAVQGDAAAGKNAHGAFVGKDPSGNLQYISLNADREVRVSLEVGDVANLSANGLATGSGSFTAVATVTLAVDMNYRKVGFVAGCFRDAEWKIDQLDDVTTTTLVQGILTGAGSLSLAEVLDNLAFTSGSSGTQSLILKAKNMNANSDFRGTLTVDEIAQV